MVLVDGQYYSFQVEETGDSPIVIQYDVFKKQVARYFTTDNRVYRETDSKKTIVAHIVKVEEKELLDSTDAIEPTWGPLISQVRTLVYPEWQKITADALLSILIGQYFPGLSVATTIVSAATSAAMLHKPVYIDMVAYFNEAAGCPQYRWYKKYEYRGEGRTVLASQNVSQKSFIGVRNSPENPPACRAYGF